MSRCTQKYLHIGTSGITDIRTRHGGGSARAEPVALTVQGTVAGPYAVGIASWNLHGRATTRAGQVGRTESLRLIRWWLGQLIRPCAATSSLELGPLAGLCHGGSGCVRPGQLEFLGPGAAWQVRQTQAESHRWSSVLQGRLSS